MVFAAINVGEPQGMMAYQLIIYEHYYKYMRKDDPCNKTLVYFEQGETKKS